MNTVQKNNNITKTELQEFIKNNSEKLGWRIFFANATKIFQRKFK